MQKGRIALDNTRRIAFLCRGFENLGVQILQGVCQDRGIETRAFIDPAPDAVFLSDNPFVRAIGLRKWIVGEILEYSPDLLCISAFTSTWEPLSQMAADIRRQIDVPVLAGGVGPTVSPEKSLADSNVDMVCVGDGENVISQVCENLKNGSSFEGIAELRTNRAPFAGIPEPVDLDTLPFPEKKDFYSAGMFRRTLRTVTGRGCPFNCSFCQNRSLKQINGRGFIRRHSPKYVLEMLTSMTGKYPVKQVMFLDSSFNSDLDFPHDFLPEYFEKIGLPYFCMIHAGNLDQDTADLLGRTGCKAVLVGMECGDEEFRSKVYNKQISDEDLQRTVMALQSAGTRVSLSVIFGAPGETTEHYGKTFDMIRKLRPDHLTTFNFFPQPKTEISENAIKSGMLDPESIYLPNLTHGNYVLRHPYAAQALTSNDLISLFFLAPRFMQNWIRRWGLSGWAHLLTRILWRAFVPFANITFTYIEGVDSLRAIYRANKRKFLKKK